MQAPPRRGRGAPPRKSKREADLSRKYARRTDTKRGKLEIRFAKRIKQGITEGTLEITKQTEEMIFFKPVAGSSNLEASKILISMFAEEFLAEGEKKEECVKVLVQKLTGGNLDGVNMEEYIQQRAVKPNQNKKKYQKQRREKCPIADAFKAALERAKNTPE